LSSGVQGFTTIHAGSARQALTRLRFICQLADTRSELPVSALNTLVSESIDLVVHCVRGPSGPRVSSIVAVEDLTGPSDATQLTVTEVFARSDPDSPLEWTGQVPSRLARRLAEHGHEIRSLIGADRAPRREARR
jgi:pilus assembly protein CpaF